MTVLDLTFLAPIVLSVQLADPQPAMVLSLPLPPQLEAELVQPDLVLQMVLRAPQALDAALLPVLIGPPGAAMPKSPSFTYAAGKLVGVLYADGSTKALTYTGDQLTQVDFARVGYPATRKTLTYNPDGTLAAVVEVDL